MAQTAAAKGKTTAAIAAASAAGGAARPLRRPARATRKLASGPSTWRRASRRGRSRRKSQNALGFQPSVRRNRGGQHVHRWYAPGTGRYTRPDPFGEQVNPNRYHYAAANPMRFVDPLGLLCQLTPQWRDCLSRIFGFPVQQIKVVDRSTMPHMFTGHRTFTLPGTILLPGPCSDFWSNTRLVLHEYYHVIDQWDTGRMTLGGYLLEGARQEIGGGDGHANNRFENEANFFAQTHRDQLRDCLGCTPLPPEPEPPFTPIREFCDANPVLCAAGLGPGRRGPF